MRRPLARTVEHRLYEGTGKIRLLLYVQKVWDLWSIRIIGPGRELPARHGPGVYVRRKLSAEGGI